jgi:hypothetical protein
MTTLIIVIHDKGAEDPTGIEIKTKRLIMPLSSLLKFLWE